MHRTQHGEPVARPTHGLLGNLAWGYQAPLAPIPNGGVP